MLLVSVILARAHSRLLKTNKLCFKGLSCPGLSLLFSIKAPEGVLVNIKIGPDIGIISSATVTGSFPQEANPLSES
jgi:hypothetical protein